MAFLLQFKFIGNFVSLSPLFQYSDRYEILYMCKSSLRSDGQRQNYSKVKFASNLNWWQKIVSETAPGP